jgi:hypothetical protein
VAVLLGYELRTGRAVSIPIAHMAVTGQTQMSGKTTTLEGLVSRCSMQAVAFLTKRGEGSFRVASPIRPYFRDRTDWPFIASILEATVGEKLKFERTEIIKLCQDYDGPEGKWSAPKSLAEVQINAEYALLKAKGIAARVYIALTEYLRMVVPELERIPYSKKLELSAGLNVMDLTEFQFPVQGLIVSSVLDEIRKTETATIGVIPEAWKFAPKQRGSPVSRVAEAYIREGAALKNFLWIDSQDIAGVAGVLLRQVTVWIFGVQRDRGEIERTLDLIPANIAKPGKQDIATLGKGQFIVAWGKEMYRVYVQPAWMMAAHAEAIARGEESVETAREIVRDFDEEHAI